MVLVDSGARISRRDLHHTQSEQTGMSGRRKSWKRWGKRLVFIILILGVITYLFRDRLLPAAPEAPQTSLVEIGDLERTVLASGELEAIRLVSVGAQATGRIEALHVELGDTVKQGDLIAEIDSLTQQNALKNAQASLASVKAQRKLEEANLKQAHATFDRQQVLLEKGAGVLQEYEAAEAALSVSQAQIEVYDAQITQAEIQVDNAEVDLAFTRITAPMDGTVVAVVVEEGQTVNAVQSAPTIIKLATLDTMTIKAEISEADVTRVSVDQEVYFTILGEPDERYYSTINSIAPAPESLQTESTTSTTDSSDEAIYYNAEFEVPNPEQKLRIAMTAEVSIVLERAERATLVPNSAIETGPDGRVLVHVLGDDQTIEARVIELGMSDGIRSVVLSGVRPGERVVTTFVVPDEVPSERRGMGPPPMF